ncbi:DUF3558 family protein [Nocardia sp. NPDC050710]|uniref:DUF3558 family protein n=1 Tax=Nocardia sp. NPDC050710 TaxID=3157220 RepID=UPI0033DF5B83
MRYRMITLGRDLLRLLVALCCLAAPIAGCAASATEPAASNAGAPSWDPCTRISDGLIREAGLDPATKRRDTAISPGPQWAGCGWSSATTALRIFSADKAAVQEVRDLPGAHEFTDITIAGRDALRYRPDFADPTVDCALVFATANGGQVRLRFDSRPDPAADPPAACDLLVETATVLIPALP